MIAYSAVAQPFLDAIAAAAFGSSAVRDWLLRETPAAAEYAGCVALHDEQRAARWAREPTKQPFWANYFCGRDARCACRIEGSKSLESDAIFFLRKPRGQVLAMHVEFKLPGEAFQPGQPEGYPLRAACFARTHAERKTLIAHDDWTTVLFCDAATLADRRTSCFHRRITHAQAAEMIPDYPAAPGRRGAST